MAELEGRVALITGASRGIGAATARALAAAGAHVVLTDLEAPTALADELGGSARKHDVTNETSWVTAIADCHDIAGGLDILINNAGLFLMKPLAETSLAEWRRIQAVNVEGVFLGCKYAIPALTKAAPRWPGGSAIINLSSMAGIVGSPGAACYNASKGAVRLLSKGLALELAPLGIRVNSVHPGVIDTAMGEAVVSGVANGGGVGTIEARSRIDALHPLGSIGAPEHIADAIVFLASDRAGFMTGTELVVDGGFTAQ